jgi:hypothetical protein
MPGPDAYTLPSQIDGPKYNMRGKNIGKNKGGNMPGPADYNPLDISSKK